MGGIRRSAFGQRLLSAFLNGKQRRERRREEGEEAGKKSGVLPPSLTAPAAAGFRNHEKVLVQATDRLSFTHNLALLTLTIGSAR